LDIPSLDFVRQNIWAIILISAGIGILCKIIFGKRHKCFWNDSQNGIIFSVGHLSEDDMKHYSGKRKGYKPGRIDRNCVFGGSKEKWDLKNFTGGEVNCVFGGIELDLSEAQLAEGVHHLKLNSVFGGIVLYVPVEWNIEMNRTNVFGAFADNRPKPNFKVDENRMLIIEANAVFGGGEIKCK